MLATWLNVHNYVCIMIYFQHNMVCANGYMFSFFFLHKKITHYICTVQMVIELYIYVLNYTHNPDTELCYNDRCTLSVIRELCDAIIQKT